ncbi:MAG: SDR family oxidoreductase [Burkholderiaceae bacterium]|nr:SDR family oxidoreductase [Burkholderiaceae bacterium]
MNARVALVTGAASGIGAATVERFVADGIRVVAFDRASAAARAGVTALVGDVTLQRDVDAAIDAARRAGGPHIVVNAAGVVAADDPENVEDATWERMLAVNLTGTMRVCRAAIPLMRAAGGGAIVNVASVAAFNSTPGSASYAPAKAGVVAYTRNIAFAHGVDGIRANCLCPGWTATAMAEAELQEAARKSGRSVAQETEALASRLALRRLARPEEMAACIRFLASDEASFVTGAVLVADGGGRIATPARGF